MKQQIINRLTHVLNKFLFEDVDEITLQEIRCDISKILLSYIQSRKILTYSVGDISYDITTKSLHINCSYQLISSIERVNISISST